MTKKETSPAGYMILECWLIMTNEDETPARRRLARKWFDRLTSEGNCWEGGGITRAEAEGIEVPANAPGGAKIGLGVGGGGKVNSYREHYDEEDASLSSEVSTDTFRSSRWAVERSEYFGR